MSAPLPIRREAELSSLARGILLELHHEKTGRLTAYHLRRRVLPSSTLALENALRQLHQARYVAWGHDQDVGECYQILTAGRMRAADELTRGRSHAER